MMPILRLILLLLTGTAPFSGAMAQDGWPGHVSLTTVAKGFDTPWSLGFLPGGDALVTERRGRLYYVDVATGLRHRVTGTPKVYHRGQGGLLDVAVARDFADSREIFLTFAKAQPGGAGTALAVARLSEDRRQLLDLRLLFEMSAGSSGGRHFGSRIVETSDGSLFVSLGERGDRDAAQDLGRHQGKIVRIRRNGAAAGDNPFTNQAGARAEIWSYGHRNPQGMALDLKGQLWAVEHGARGGDEVNRITKGANYGWPVIAYGRHYSGLKIGEGQRKAGMEQPQFFWDPSIAPSGLMIYSGKLWPEWRGAMFVGSLKFDYISRLAPGGGREMAQWRRRETARVRDIREAADGTIWFISEDHGVIYRLAPH